MSRGAFLHGPLGLRLVLRCGIQARQGDPPLGDRMLKLGRPGGRGG